MKRTLRNDQKGMVAIIVTMIMIFVITLIVIGFSDVTRRNQREELDKQLGTQAYYAAETGVNDVVTSMKSGFTPISTNCTSFTAHTSSGGAITLPRSLKTDNSVATTCITIDSNPPKLQVDTIAPTTDNVIWDVKDGKGLPFSTLNLSWKPQATTGAPCSTAVGTYPPATAWNCDYALMRVDVVKVGTAVDAATLAANTSTLFLQPRNDGGALSLAGALGSRLAYQGSCKIASGTCSTTLTMGGAAANEYYVRLTTMYTTAKTVVLQGTDSFGAATFTGGQVVIDSTGRAQDQLKRIQVRVPLTATSSVLPIFGIQSTGTICKDITYSSSLFHLGQCATPTSPSPGGGGTITGAFVQGDNSGGGGSSTTVCTGQCIYYTSKFTITHSPASDGATVNSCSWDWGDGTTNTYSGSRCDVGTVEQYFYNKNGVCTDYTVTLVFHTNQGDIQTISKKITVPTGKDSGC